MEGLTDDQALTWLKENSRTGNITVPNIKYDIEEKQ